MATYDELMASELQEGETLLKQEAGDYWKYLLFMGIQNRGRYFVTNKRIMFYYCGSKDVEIEFKDIESMKTCNVGPLIRFVPTGIKIVTKAGKKHYLSVLKRKNYLELFQLQMKENGAV